MAIGSSPKLEAGSHFFSRLKETSPEWTQWPQKVTVPTRHPYREIPNARAASGAFRVSGRSGCSIEEPEGRARPRHKSRPQFCLLGPCAGRWPLGLYLQA